VNRRTRWHATIAALSLFMLLVAVDVCLLVTCAPRVSAKPRCSHCTAPDSNPAAPAPHGADANAPCCIQGTLAATPLLAAPAEAPADALPVLLAVAHRLAPATLARAARAPDESPPPLAAHAAPRGERAPPLA
jgi:hypothetical protein